MLPWKTDKKSMFTPFIVFREDACVMLTLISTSLHAALQKHLQRSRCRKRDGTLFLTIAPWKQNAATEGIYTHRIHSVGMLLHSAHPGLSFQERHSVGETFSAQRSQGAAGRREQSLVQTLQVLHGKLWKSTGTLQLHHISRKAVFLSLTTHTHTSVLTITFMLASLSCVLKRPLWTGHTSCTPAKGDTVMVRPTGRTGQPSVKPPSIHF